MKKLAGYATLTFLFFVLIGSDVFAADKTITWVNPTHNTDGSPLDLATIVSYDLGCTSIDDQNYLVTESFPASLPLPTLRIFSLSPGEYWCVLRLGTVQQTSAWSNEVFFTLAWPIPNPAENLAVD
jgi:hypothetical protein